MAYDNPDTGVRKLIFSKGKVAFTIREAFKIYEISQNTPRQQQSATHWKRIADSGLFPNRTGESLRECFKTHFKVHDLQAFMRYAIDRDLRYCHAFKEIPKINNYLDPNTIKLAE